MSSTKKVVEFNGKKIILLGTAHVSKESIDEVTQEISQTKPDCVAIELDQKRYDAMMDPESYRKLDIIKVLKRKEGFLMIANIILSSFQKRMGQNIGVKPGDEMLAAINCAAENNIPSVMVDRPIHVTLRRAWAKNSFWGKCKLLSALIASAFDKEEVSEEEIESLKQENEMDTMMQGLADYLPKVKEVLIDERDRYLASNIWQCEGKTVIAVLGAGHLPGVESWLSKFAAGESTDVSQIDQVPPKGVGSKIAGWIIPAIIAGLIGWSFYKGGMQVGEKMVLNWVIWNASLSAIGALLALAHPLAILLSAVLAPFTSLCPLVGVGMFSGILQAVLKKPKVEDMENIQSDAGSIKGVYKNRILRVLLVFFLSSLGSTIGTFAAGTDMIVLLSNLFK